jgi:L-fuconolactonase
MEIITIDAHQHFWHFDPVRDSWITDDMRAIRADFTPYDIYRELRENDVAGCVAVQADQSEQETAFLVDIAERHEFVRGVVGWVDLTSPFLAQRLAFYHRTAPKVKGFRHIVQAEPDDEFLLREEVSRGIGQLRSFGYSFDLLVYPRQLPAAIRLTEKFPDQRFVLDHLAKPDIAHQTLEPWATQIKILARHPNVYCKLSGMVTEADWKNWTPATMQPYLDVAFEAFGPGRLMFGSDWPVCLLAANYSQVKALVANYLKQCSADEQAAVMGGNAITFYQL